MKCKSCDGVGSLPCSGCAGEGVDYGISKCSTCEGKGSIVCETCDGKGKVGLLSKLIKS